MVCGYAVSVDIIARERQQRTRLFVDVEMMYHIIFIIFGAGCCWSNSYTNPPRPFFFFQLIDGEAI